MYIRDTATIQRLVGDCVYLSLMRVYGTSLYVTDDYTRGSWSFMLSERACHRDNNTEY